MVTKKIEDKEESLYVIVADALKEMRFDEAYSLVTSQLDEAHIKPFFHQLTEEFTGLLSYTFVCFLIKKEEKSLWHQVACSVMYNAVTHQPGRLYSAYYHINRAIELQPDNLDLKEYALNFFAEGVLPRDKALSYASEVLKAQPKNHQATEILASLR